jgi:hypothetical protein
MTIHFDLREDDDSDTNPLPEHGWTCFHCGAWFNSTIPGLDAAKLHFGSGPNDAPACKIDAGQLRWLEGEHRRSVEEDTEALRTIASLVCQHNEENRRAEERGYARGLEDAKKYPEELGLARAQQGGQG